MYEIEEINGEQYVEEINGEQYVRIPAVDMEMDGDREAGRLLIKILGVNEDWPTALDMVMGRIEE